MTGLASLLAAAALQAAGAASASASAVIVTPLRITNVAELSFGRLQYNGGGRAPPVGAVVVAAQPPAARTSAEVQLLPNGGEGPAIRTITGDPRRAFRVTVLPTTSTPGGLTVDNFTVWSANSGNITSRAGVLDDAGADTLRIGATLKAPVGTKPGVYTARPTINIAYE